MAWQKYPLVFHLESPLHIGYRKTGNLMQTRRYVPGKNLWAALTARLTRDKDNGRAKDRYIAIGSLVNEYFRFSYLYPALAKKPGTAIKSATDLIIYYPWGESLFDYRFLGSYASTALNYDYQAAAEGLLHEVEFIRPRARLLPGDEKAPEVYLMGYLYVQDNPAQELVNWRGALGRVQLGGERGYGWGRVRLEPLPTQGESTDLIITVKKDETVPAHLLAQKANAIGPVEPLVGWERDNDPKSAKNWCLSSPKICYAPGAVVNADSNFAVAHYGIWEPIV